MKFSKEVGLRKNFVQDEIAKKTRPGSGRKGPGGQGGPSK